MTAWDHTAAVLCKVHNCLATEPTTFKDCHPLRRRKGRRDEPDTYDLTLVKRLIQEDKAERGT